MPPKKRAMDVLDDLCGEHSDESSTDDEKGQPPVNRTAGGSSKLSVEALARAGYTSGPSVLHVPEQRSTEPESTWEWSKGHEQQDRDASPTERERSHMRQATSSGVTDDALYARRLLEHSERLRQEKRAEKEAKAKKGQLSFKEKEKRKRDAGQQSSSKNYVEEEKRRAREAGCYTGFDS